jgi:hypothetical protein
MIWGFEKASVARLLSPGLEAKFAFHAQRMYVCILETWKSLTLFVVDAARKRVATSAVMPTRGQSECPGQALKHNADCEPFREHLRLYEVTWLLRIFCGERLEFFPAYFGGSSNCK